MYFLRTLEDTVYVFTYAPAYLFIYVVIHLVTNIY